MVKYVIKHNWLHFLMKFRLNNTFNNLFLKKKKENLVISAKKKTQLLFFVLFCSILYACVQNSYCVSIPISLSPLGHAFKLGSRKYLMFLFQYKIISLSCYENKQVSDCFLFLFRAGAIKINK